MSSNKKTSLKNKEVELAESVQMNIYQSNTLNWLHFGNELRVQEMQQVKDQQSYTSGFVAYLTIPSSCLEYQPRWQQCSMHGWMVDL